MKKLLVILSLIALIALIPTVAFGQTWQSPSAQPSGGPSVDKKGDPVIDPTRNVLDLVAAGNKRLDDLSAANQKLVESSIQSLKDSVLRESLHNKEVAELRAGFQTALNEKESKRLDSVRAVDQLAVTTASDRAQAAITALASQAAVTAETLRGAVNTSAANLAAQLVTTNAGINDRISSLEKAQYTGAGRAIVADPQLQTLQTLVDKLATSNSTSVGKTEGISSSWAILVGAAGLIGGVIVAFAMLRKSPSLTKSDIGELIAQQNRDLHTDREEQAARDRERSGRRT